MDLAERKVAGESVVWMGVILVATLLLASVITAVPPRLGMVAGLAVGIFIIALANTQAALYILIFSMLLSPEFIVGQTAGASLGRGVTLRLDDFLLVIIGLSWFAKTAIHKELGLFKTTPLNRPIFYYIAVCTISTGVGMMLGRVEPKTGFFFVLKYFEYFVVYFMVVNNISSRRQVKYFVIAMLVTCFAVSIVGIAQIPGGGRVTAPFEGETGEPNTFGGYLVLMLALVLGLLLNSKGARERLLLGTLLVFIIVPFLATQSRGSYVAFVPMYLSLIFFGDKKRVLILILVLAVIFGPFVVPSAVKNRVVYTFRQPAQYGQLKVGGLRVDTSTSARLRSWRNVIARDWIKHPLLGYGVTGYRFLDAQYPRVLAETGVLGFAAFVWLLYSLYKRVREFYQKTEDRFYKGLSLGFLGGFMAMLGHSVGCNTFIIVRIMEPFWFLAGLVIMLPAIQEPENVNTGEINTRLREEEKRLEQFPG